MAKLVIPNIFTPGTPAQASQVNANFQAVANWTASGQVDTDSIQIPLGFRSNNDQGQSQPILRFLQQNDDPILDLINANGESSILIKQQAALDAGVGAIQINDTAFQNQSTAAMLKMKLKDTAISPAILIQHDAIETMRLTKSEFRVIDSIFKVNATQMLIPRVTTGDRPANAEQGSVVFNTTTKQLDEKKAASGGWAPVGAPVGSIFMWPNTDPPDGWLICNGNTVTNGPDTIQGVTADFSALYAVLNNATWNAKLPDLRGAFVRGTGTNSFSPGSPAVPQTGPALGQWQDDATALNGIAPQTSTAINTANTSPTNLNHGHDVQFGTNTIAGLDSGGNQGSGAEWGYSEPASGSNQRLPFAVATSVDHRHTITSSDTETRPFSIGLNYIIKY